MATSYTHSIPTPPFSPHNYRMPDENAENPLKSTINLLDSLVAFYQHERMWVYRTRAMLEEAFPDPPVHPTEPGHTDQSLISPSMGEPRHDETMETPPSRGQQATRWNRRKKGFKLRLDGIRNRRMISTQPVGQMAPEQLQPREQLLEMFEKMMESRMESCQRVNKLVREANRANLHYR